MGYGKWQMGNGKCESCAAPTRHVPFNISHLPFEILVAFASCPIQNHLAALAGVHHLKSLAKVGVVEAVSDDSPDIQPGL